MPVVNPLGCPHAASCCLAAAGSPPGLLSAWYRSNFWKPTMFGGIAVDAMSPPYGPPYAFCRVVLFAAYMTAIRQWTLFSGGTLVLMYSNHRNPLIGSSEDALSDGLDRILARAADCTPVPAWSIWMPPAIRRLSMSLALAFRLTTILLASCLTCGSRAGFQFGFFTSVNCLLSW